MAKETTKIFVAKCPVHFLWFERFVKGLHNRMGNDHQQDTAVFSGLMYCLMERIEVGYLEEENVITKCFIARAELFFLRAYFGSLRGEEVNRIQRKYFINLNQVLLMFGNFKGKQGVPHCYFRRVVIRVG